MASKSTTVAISVVGLFIIIISSIILVSNNQKNTKQVSESSSSSISIKSDLYKDGTYTTSGNYNTPGGQESIEVTLALKNGLINTVSTSSSAKERQSQQYQMLFKEKISGLVAGKTLDKGTVGGSINGASLTGKGFNEALKKIADQARN